MGKLHKLFFPKAGIFVTSDYCNLPPIVLYYNRQEERVLRKGTPARSVKKIKKPLDKLQNLCYNKHVIKGRTP